jgi:hypothetical protein
VANINASVDGQLGTGRSLYTETEEKKVDDRENGDDDDDDDVGREGKDGNLVEGIQAGKLEALGSHVERLLVRLRHDGDAIGSNLKCVCVCVCGNRI